MTTSDANHAPRRERREPPGFRRVEVRRVQRLSPRMIRITVTGADLQGFAVDEPAASVRVLLPDRATGALTTPVWNGNEFLRADGRRPMIRTFTPRRVDADTLEVDIDVVIHGNGPASAWAVGAGPGSVAALSGPGRGYVIDPATPAHLLAGDETAIPAISQLLEVLPGAKPARVLIETTTPDARLDLPPRDPTTVDWLDMPADGAPGDALVDAIRASELAPGTHVWAAGEAAAMQRIRRFLFDDRRLPRAQTTIRGYWKRGRAGAGTE